MGPASDRRSDLTHKPPLSAVTAEVLWLQRKFDELLEQQQSLLVTLSEVLKRLDALENKSAVYGGPVLDGPGPVVDTPAYVFDFRGPSRFTE